MAASLSSLLSVTANAFAQENSRGTALGFFGGFAFGGDELLVARFDDGSEQTMRAGDGVCMSFHGMHTPIWFGEHAFGLGGRGDFGFKVSSITADNGSMNFWRFPLVGMAHAVTRISEHVFIPVAFGFHYEIARGLSGSDALEPFDVDVENGLGWTTEVSMYWHGGLVFETGGRYTSLTLDFAGTPIDASSFMAFFKAHFAG